MVKKLVERVELLSHDAAWRNPGKQRSETPAGLWPSQQLSQFEEQGGEPLVINALRGAYATIISRSAAWRAPRMLREGGPISNSAKGPVT